MNFIVDKNYIVSVKKVQVDDPTGEPITRKKIIENKKQALHQMHMQLFQVSLFNNLKKYFQRYNFNLFKKKKKADKKIVYQSPKPKFPV